MDRDWYDYDEELIEPKSIKESIIGLKMSTRDTTHITDETTSKIKSSLTLPLKLFKRKNTNYGPGSANKKQYSTRNLLSVTAPSPTLAGFKPTLARKHSEQS